MHIDHSKFIQAIKDRRQIILTYYSGEKSFYITRLVVPLDYKPISKAGPDYYSFGYQEEDNKSVINLPSYLIKFIEIGDEKYNPSDFESLQTSN